MYEPEMPDLKSFKGPKLIYVYNPMCPACIMRGPLFDKEALLSKSKKIFSFNGRQYSQEFYEHTGVRIPFFPSLYGITKKGLVVQIDGNPSATQLKNILIALEAT